MSVVTEIETGDREKIEKIEALLKKTFGSQYKDDFQDGQVCLADKIADILEMKK